MTDADERGRRIFTIASAVKLNAHFGHTIGFLLKS
jgi:hypothetical protein